jgi:hypothetical protein
MGLLTQRSRAIGTESREASLLAARTGVIGTENAFKVGP